MTTLHRDPLSVVLLSICCVCAGLIMHMLYTPGAAAQSDCQEPPPSPYGIRES